MTTIHVRLEPAPTTPLNLQFGIVYAPRVATPPFVGYRAIDIGQDGIVVEAIDDAGDVVRTYRGDLRGAFVRLATHLGMVA